jgi:hypothetical protein
MKYASRAHGFEPTAGKSFRPTPELDEVIEERLPQSHIR